MKFSIDVNHEWCKGCYICIKACPKDVISHAELTSVRGFKPITIDHIEACVGCMICEYQCPDFAITVVR